MYEDEIMSWDDACDLAKIAYFDPSKQTLHDFVTGFGIKVLSAKNAKLKPGEPRFTAVIVDQGAHTVTVQRIITLN